MITVDIFADGGLNSIGGYGSFKVSERDDNRFLGFSMNYVPLPLAQTSNEAEYYIQLYALDKLFRTIGQNTEVAEDFALSLHSDSQLVVNQTAGLWSVHADNLKVLRADLLAILNIFGSWEITWVQRSVMIALFGH